MVYSQVAMWCFLILHMPAFSCTHSFKQQNTRNQCKKCCVTAVCLAPPFLLTTPLPPQLPSPTAPRLFLEISEMRERESNYPYSAHCQRVRGWMTEGEVGRQRGWGDKLSEVKKKKRVKDETLGVRQEGWKEERQWRPEGWEQGLRKKSV